MNNIKLIRLQNGDDIIASYEIRDNTVFVSEPMLVEMHLQGGQMAMILQHWLPIQIIKSNQTLLQSKDIVCVVDPTNELIEYYVNTVEKIKNLFAARDALDEERFEDEMESINLAMEELNEGINVIH